MKKTLNFLKQIKKNNNSVWMQGHRDDYAEAKKEFEFLTQELIMRLGEWDSSLPFLEPKDCIFRFNRDTRFSDNKSPYKENFGAFIAYGGKKGGLPGYYLHISPKEVFVSGGVWLPEADVLKKVRQYILDEGEEFEKILKERNFKKAFSALDDGDRLKRPPKGFSADHPMLEHLKNKSFTITSQMSSAEALKPAFAKLIIKNFKLMKPLNQYLLRAINN